MVQLLQLKQLHLRIWRQQQLLQAAAQQQLQAVVCKLRWNYDDALADTGKTPKQLETAGAEDGYSWRGGQQHRPQRWAEHVQLLKAIEAAWNRLTEQARKASQQPHQVAQVGPVAAARELDAQRMLLQLSV
jgi:hypothetical protein